MGTTQTRMADLGLVLPTVAAPLAAYVPAVRNGQYVHTSGQLPLVGGELAGVGLVGRDVSVEEAAALARICILNALAAVHALIGDLDRIRQVVKVTGYVASTPDFTQHPVVINGASELLVSVLGDRGTHVRSAVGVASLPLGAPVEVELLVELE